MKNDNAQTYVTGVGDQLAAAVARGDADAADRILDRVDADGNQAAAVILAGGVAATSLGPAMTEPPMPTTDEAPDVLTDYVMATALRLSVERIVAVSKWVDGATANAARDPEALTRIRLDKLATEVGEVLEALDAATGTNPRKGVHGSMAAVHKEVLDVATAALAAYEHLTGNMGFSFAALFAHIAGTHERAGLDTPGGAE